MRTGVPTLPYPVWRRPSLPTLPFLPFPTPKGGRGGEGGRAPSLPLSLPPSPIPYGGGERKGDGGGGGKAGRVVGSEARGGWVRAGSSVILILN